MRNPNVPESLDSWWILHRLFSFDRLAFDALSPAEQDKLASEAVKALSGLKGGNDCDLGLAQLLGHRADLMLTHYSRNYEGLLEAELLFDKTGLAAYMTSASSYVSILELGLYDATGKIHAALSEQGLKPHTDEWNAAFDDLLKKEEQNPRNAGRLWAKVPQRRFVCFYPMDKKRGETVNWYMLPFEERARLMLEHGKIGRMYHGLVTQVISGSIGFDSFEWGVDLYADDPLVFKKLIYEMRFDEASAAYGIFGDFYSGLQFSLEQLPVFLEGSKLPALLQLQPTR